MTRRLRPNADWILIKGADIACSRCGSREKLLPNTVEGMKIVGDEFTKVHAKCVLPEAPRRPGRYASPLEWVVGEDTGISSKTIWAVMMGVRPAEADVPYDVSDFGRCYRLLESFPEWKSRLGEVAKAYKAWKPFIEQWHLLVASYEQEALVDKSGRAPKVYDLLRQIRKS